MFNISPAVRIFVCIPDVRFINGEYAPVEIERRQVAMLLEGIDTFRPDDL